MLTTLLINVAIHYATGTALYSPQMGAARQTIVNINIHRFAIQQANFVFFYNYTDFFIVGYVNQINNIRFSDNCSGWKHELYTGT